MNKLNKAIICNNCLGARFYKEHEYEFNNPFMWNCIELNEFIKLIKNLNNIDMSKPIFSLVKTETRHYVNAVIGDNINFNFIHYLYDEKQNEPIKIGADIIYKDILEYVKTKYFERLSRMPKDKIFIVNTAHYKSEEHFVNSKGEILLKSLDILANTNKIIVILDKQHKLTYKPNFIVIYENNLYSKSAIELLSKDNELDKELCKYIFKA